MANVEANQAYSAHLEDLDNLARKVTAYLTDARFGIRHGVASGLESMDQAHSAMEEFRSLALALDAAVDGARIMAQASGSRGAVYRVTSSTGTITGVWGEA